MSEAVVEFLGELLPLYAGERRGESRCARSLTDGTLIFPCDEADGDDPRGMVTVWWHGDPSREQFVEGSFLATLALERYVRLHGVGANEEAIAAELWFMARHFHFKTGCEVYLPNLAEPANALVKAARTVMAYGGGILVAMLKGSMS